jgi:hypothetical protein
VRLKELQNYRNGTHRSRPRPENPQTFRIVGTLFQVLAYRLKVAQNNRHDILGCARRRLLDERYSRLLVWRDLPEVSCVTKLPPYTNTEPLCRRQSITFQKTELEQLESKLREMEVELQEKQSQLPLISDDTSGSDYSIIQKPKGPEAALEPDMREGAQEENTTAKATPGMRTPTAVSEARPPSSPSHPSTSTSRQAVQKRRKTVDSRSRNLPSRGRP